MTEQNTETMIEQLSEIWQGNDLILALGIIDYVLAHGDQAAQTIARTCLGNALQHPRAVKTVVPVLAEGLKAQDAKIRQQAAIGLQMVAKRGGTIKMALTSLSICLADVRGVASSAARALWLGSLKKVDLSNVRSALESALSSSIESVRVYASKALSEHLAHTREEARLKLDHLASAKVMPYGWEYMDGPAKVVASHRRTYAATDQAIEPTELIHTCAVCGSEETRCIYYAIDAGVSWKQETYEVLCPSCGKYVVYEYDW